MVQIIPHIISGNTFLLSVNRCIYWVEKKILILSDLHLGKTGHFRKAGIAVPQSVFKEDMQRLVTQLQSFQPEQVIIIGDMFHSHGNKEHDLFVKWRRDFGQLVIHLVKGNHDILNERWYADAGIQVSNCELKVDRFVFVHDFNDCTIPEADYIFSGHIHPGISIHGVGKQSLRFPCFYFGDTYAVLPAFSRFTGMYDIRPKAGENVYALISPNPSKEQAAGIMKI